ncbi:MAG: alpha/beta hydrolase fold protein [Betaproteobacteria bacterium]|nr:alpha/beta hydrolase fold protein [Betaproteobacteria bacterium]
MNASRTGNKIEGREHWAKKGDVSLFLWEKPAVAGLPKRGTVLFVHGSSMGSQPVFDLRVDGIPDASTMEYFAERGFDTWCVDMEGYGRSDKKRGIDATIAEGADDLAAAWNYIQELRKCGPVMLYGVSSGALRAALFAQRHPERVARLALDAFVWTGEGSSTLEQRRKKLPEFMKTRRRPIDMAFMRSIFERDHPGTADERTIQAFGEFVLELDDSIPNGTYIDMCNNLPVVDPLEITVPTIVMRGEFDGIAAIEDVLRFFQKLPNPDKQFAMLPGIAHASLQEKNFRTVLHVMHSFFSQPPLLYGR